MSTENTAPVADEAQDAMAAEWAAALAEAKPAAATEVEQVAPAQFNNLAQTTAGLTGAGNDINMILDIPVQLTVELGRTRIPIKHILQLAQGSVRSEERRVGKE